MSATATLFDPDLERRLLLQWVRDRDARARDRLVAAQQPFVIRKAKRYGGASHAVADLVQEGNLGLLHALDRFDPDRGVRLATYAAWWIRAFILRFVEHNRGLIRGATTANRTRLFYQLARTRQRLAAEGEDVSREAIAHALGVEESDVEAMELLRMPTASLDAPVHDNEGAAVSRLERLVDDAPTPEQRVQTQEMEVRLGRALEGFGATLRGRKLEMFRDRVAAARPASLHELGSRWGITRAAARRLEDQVARPLRRHLYREMGDTITVALGAV